MRSDLSNLRVKITRKPFTSPSGIVYPQSALITADTNVSNEPLSMTLGYRNKEEIFQLLERKQVLILDHCYVDFLSLEEYRKTHNLKEKEIISVAGISAIDSLFDCTGIIDLSNADFTGEKIDFSLSCFYRGNIDLHNSSVNVSEINFTGMRYFGDEFDFSNVRIENGILNFKNAEFSTGRKNFQYTDFGSKNKVFTNAQFGDGDVSFVNSHFNNGDVNFKVANFGTGKIDFHFASFGKGDKIFDRCNFGDGHADFRTVDFGSGRIIFNRSVFREGDILFEGSEQKEGKFLMKKAQLGKGKLSFEMIEMGKTEFNLEKTNFSDSTLSFYHARVHFINMNYCHLNRYTDLRVARAAKIDLSNTIVRDIIDIKTHEFSEQIGVIFLAGVRLIGRIYIDWSRNAVKDLIQKQEEVSNYLKAEQFRILKENFNTCGQYDDEDKAYLMFKRYEAKAALEKHISRNKWNTAWAYPLHLFKLLIFDKAGHYATNPLRVILSMGIAYTFFSFLYFLLIILKAGNIVESVVHDHVLKVLGTSFYHSAITFLTIGYGDYYPEGAVRWVSGIEGFTGVFLMSYFTVAFVRKILR